MKAAIDLDDPKYWLQRSIENLTVCLQHPSGTHEAWDRVMLIMQTVTLLLMFADAETPQVSLNTVNLDKERLGG
jgi:hypothetical protein